MLQKTLLWTVLLSCLLMADNISDDDLNGNWHLRIMDGMDVRKARAILDFDMNQMKLSGFDACNSIVGTLVKNSDTDMTIPMLMLSKMACRNKIHHWVSKRLHVALKEGFHIYKAKAFGVKCIILKSPSHELFFKKMGKQVKQNSVHHLQR